MKMKRRRGKKIWYLRFKIKKQAREKYEETEGIKYLKRCKMRIKIVKWESTSTIEGKNKRKNI